MRGLRIVLAAVWAPAAAAAGACDAGAALTFPVSEVLLAEAWDLHLEEYARTDWDAVHVAGRSGPDGSEYRAAVADALAPLGPIEADVRLLALLEVAAGRSGAPVTAVTSSSASAVHDLFLAVLDRRDLPGQAAALRAAQAAYPRWEGTPEDRRRQWIGADGTVSNPALLARLDALSARYAAARPTVMERALDLVAGDPTLAARYEAARIAAGDEARLAFLVGELFGCLDLGWWTPGEAEAALGELPPPQREIVVLQTFLAEAMNGSVHQFFYNSSGTLAPELAEIFDRHGLADHAAAVRRGMAEWPGRYPRDTDLRRKIMAGFAPAQDEALYALTAWADDGATEALMVRIARDAGLWPR
jgi:hypothetical protein